MQGSSSAHSARPNILPIVPSTVNGRAVLPESPVMSDRPTTPDRVVRRIPGHEESVRADRYWWDAEAEDYYAEHGDFLGDTDLVWGPEGWTEEDLRLLGDPADLAGLRVLEVGGGAGQAGRWCAARGAQVISSDVSGGMLRVARRIDRRTAGPDSPDRPDTRAGDATTPTYLQCDGARPPLADASLDLVLTAHGVLAFIPDAAAAFAEWCRVLRPGGRVVCSLPHPVRWAFPDVPGPEGLTVRHSYFDRRAYVEETDTAQVTYVEHHRTVGDLVRAVVGAGLVLDDLVEPEWPADRDHEWGGWSRLRGEAIPGTLIVIAHRPG